MPQSVGQLEQMGAAVRWQRLAGAVDIGEIADPAPQGAGLVVAAEMNVPIEAALPLPFDLAEMQGEGELLLVGELLAAIDQHGMAVHAGLDRSHALRRQRFAAIDAADLAGEGLGEGLDGKRHWEAFHV